MSLKAAFHIFTNINAESPEVLKAQGRRVAVLSVVLLAIILIPFLWKPWIHGNDGARNYVYLRSAALDHDFDFTNEFNHYRQTGDYQITLPNDPNTGLPGNALGVGSSVLWAPFFFAGHVVALLTSSSADGYSAPYEWAISLGSTCYAILGLLLLTHVLASRFYPFEALIAVVAVWLGSPLVFYMYLHPSMSHSCSFFLCSLLVWQYERWKDTPRVREAVLVGITCGLAMATRFNNGVFLLLVMAFWMRSWFYPAGHAGDIVRAGWRWKAAIAIAVGFLIGFFPQMAAWRVMHDAWLSGPKNYQLGQNLSLCNSPHAIPILFSGWRGMFVWSPVLLVSSAGFLAMLRERRVLDFALLLMFIAQVWVIGGWNMWWGGASFGQRFFINFTPAFALGLAWLVGKVRPGGPRKFLLGILAACLIWNAGLAMQYVSGIIPREEPVSIPTLIRNQFTQVPRAVLGHVKYLIPGFRHNGASPGQTERPGQK